MEYQYIINLLVLYFYFYKELYEDSNNVNVNNCTVVWFKNR